MGNLININSRANAKELQKQAGIRSGKVRRENRLLKDILPTLLETKLADAKLSKQLSKKYNLDTEEITILLAMHAAQIDKALAGNTTAYNAIMDRVYGKPIQQIEQPNIKQKHKLVVEFVST